MDFVNGLCDLFKILNDGVFWPLRHSLGQMEVSSVADARESCKARVVTLNLSAGSLVSQTVVPVKLVVQVANDGIFAVVSDVGDILTGSVLVTFIANVAIDAMNDSTWRAGVPRVQLLIQDGKIVVLCFITFLELCIGLQFRVVGQLIIDWIRKWLVKIDWGS